MKRYLLLILPFMWGCAEKKPVTSVYFIGYIINTPSQVLYSNLMHYSTTFPNYDSLEQSIVDDKLCQGVMLSKADVVILSVYKFNSVFEYKTFSLKEGEEFKKCIIQNPK